MFTEDLANKHFKVTLEVNKWRGNGPYIYTVTNKVIKDDERQLITVTESANMTEEQFKVFVTANIRRGSQSNGSFTLKCWGKKPTIELDVEVTVGGVI